MPLLDDIKKLTEPVFELPDLEDEDVDGTASKTINKGAAEEGDVRPRTIRKAIDLSVDDSSKYGGAKVSRGDMFDEFSDMADLGGHLTKNGDADSDSDGGFEHDDEQDAEQSLASEEQDHSDGLDDENSDEESADGSGSDDADAHSTADSGEEDGNEHSTENGTEKQPEVTMKHLLKTVDQDKQHKKAESVSVQTQTWEQLLYVKIKLQSALRLFNQLPRGQLAKDLLKEADEETKKHMKQAHNNATKLAAALLEAESLLLASSSFTSSIVGKKSKADSDDEEIESSTDGEGDDEEADDDGDDLEDEDVDDDNKDDDDDHVPHQTSLSMKSLSKRLCENDERFSKFRDSTLVKWDGRTRLIASRRAKSANTDFSAFEKENIVSQIEKVCADKQRMVKRSRVKKSDVERIGGNPEAEEDEEIYDDDDFYQVLLKELIDRKASNTQDPVAMTRHYIELQKLKSKRTKKKDIDHRASKDRKIKYVPIPKLINFHPAMPELVEWSHESRNELFKSLFS
ncbi:hypothetical protein Q1695_009868 [Nippostrongylus brasiliensis]|nr:hypothetical protein Q1695_009868 [Nippostrongylus brasiliensis]